VSAIDSLIRLHRWQLDERRRQLADLEGLAAKLRQEQQRLDAEQLTEQAVAEASLAAMRAYGLYAPSLIERRQKLADSLAEIERRLAQAREALAAEFQDAKRYDVTAANRERRQRRQLERRQMAILDELGLDRFKRRKAAEE
jgi:flagellar protein FliJ